MEINLKNKKKHWLILISFLTEFVDDYDSMIAKAEREADEEPEPELSEAKT